MTIQKLAGQYRQCFELRKRLSGEEFWSWRDDLEEPLKDHLQDLVCEWHDGMLPNDNRYKMIVELLDAICESDNLDEIDIDDIGWDRTENIEWLNQSLNAGWYIDSQDQSLDFWSTLQCARLQEYEDLTGIILSSLEKEIPDYE